MVLTRAAGPACTHQVLRLLLQRGHGVLVTSVVATPASGCPPAGHWVRVYHNAVKDWICMSWPSAWADDLIDRQVWALQHEDRGAHHRLQAGHRRHGGVSYLASGSTPIPTKFGGGFARSSLQ